MSDKGEILKMFDQGFFSQLHTQREYEECIVSLLCRKDFPCKELEISSFSPQEAARLGYIVELSLKIANRCGIKPPESLSNLLTLAKQKVKNSPASNIPLFESGFPGSVQALGRHWRLTQELILKNVENEVKRWMIRSKKELDAFSSGWIK